MKKKYWTIIVGGGPSGMAAALELYRAKKDFILIEKCSAIGGLSKTLIFKEKELEFRTDIGPHRFYTKNDHIDKLVKGLTQEKLLVVKRSTRQFIDGKFFDYPINSKQILKNLGIMMVTHIIVDYFLSVIKYRLLKKPIITFYDYAVANFGKTLANFNIINYTEKIWGMPTNSLSADWAKHRIKGLSLLSVIKKIVEDNLFIKSKSEIKTLVETFFYPEIGAGFIYEQIRNNIERGGYDILLNRYPTKIIHDNYQIKAIQLNVNGDSEVSIGLEYLIESITITDFLNLLYPSPPKHILEAASKLHYRSQVYLFLTIDLPKITEDQWIYFPDKDVPFARISEMKNFSCSMSPLNKTSLLVEFFCNREDKMYNLEKEELFELVLPYLERYGFFKRKDVRKYYKFKGYKDYPIYDLTYQSNLETIKRYLDAFENLYYIGRPGRFEYTSQDQSIEMGVNATKSIINKYENKIY